MKTRMFPNLLVVAFTLACVVATPTALRADAPPSDEELRKLALEVLAPIPDKMPGAENDTKDQIRLGEKLFFDKRLSVNNTISCNTCHVVDKKRGGVDNQPTSPGAFGKRGDRNSPTVLNAGFHVAQFWDGRAADLVEQAQGPVLNSVEMAMPDEALVLSRLNADAQYQKMFKKSFPEEKEPITYLNAARAIAAFERTLITEDRLDDYLQGKNKALSALEKKGLHTFLTVGCTTCHNGALLGGTSYMKAGLVNPYENTHDIGRAAITKEEDDKYKFKVPSLRNVAITGPYFHDGVISSLDEAVEKMGWMQLGLKLEEDQKVGLVAFLQSLTDKKRTAP